MAWVSGRARAKHQRGGRPAARESDWRLDGKHAPGHFQIRLCPGETSPSPALRLLGLAVHFVNQGVKGRHL